MAALERPGLLDAAEARRRLVAALPPLASETVALGAAGGRLCAHAVHAPEDLPRFARAAMDGYAVAARDTAGASAAAPVRLPLAAPDAGALAPGHARAIATGAPVPDGADAVIMVESTRAAGTVVELLAEVAPGRNVIQRADDVAAGAVVVPARHVVTARDLAVAGAVGVERVEVVRRPRVAVLSSGSELVAPGALPTGGQVRDVNQPALAAAARDAGADVTLAGIVRDDPEAVASALAGLVGSHDVIVISGGTSVGTADHTAAAVHRLGAQLLFHGLAIRPGRPTLAATLPSGQLLIGLPGVPGAALVVFTVFVRPLLERMTRDRADERTRSARLTTAVASALGREDYVRVTLEQRAGGLFAEPVAAQASSLLALAAADGIAVVPPDVAALAAGDSVAVLLF